MNKIKNYTQYITETKLYEPTMLSSGLAGGDIDWQALTDEDINHIQRLTKLPVVKESHPIKHLTRKNDNLIIARIKHKLFNKVTNNPYKNITIVKLLDDYFIVQYTFGSNTANYDQKHERLQSKLYKVDGWDGLQQCIIDCGLYEA